MKMTEAASNQALQIGKERLREFLESSDTGRQAMAMSGRSNDVPLSRLDGKGKKMDDEDDGDDI